VKKNDLLAYFYAITSILDSRI